MQMPQHRHRQPHNHRIENQTRDRRAVEDGLGRQASAPAHHRLVPGIPQRAALCEAKHKHSGAEQDDHGAHDLAGDAQAADGEDAHVEEEDGDFGDDE
ncbi:MAG: hypothetical protein Q9210_007619, partial [Variospora velana]